MIIRLQTRWAQWEQPLLLLSFVLHPKYRLSKFSNSLNLSYTYFGQWLGYYYQVWFEKLPTSILREYLSYQREVFPFDHNTYIQFNEKIAFDVGNTCNYCSLGSFDKAEKRQSPNRSRGS